jgi:hypothetical protein
MKLTLLFCVVGVLATGSAFAAAQDHQPFGAAGFGSTTGGPVRAADTQVTQLSAPVFNPLITPKSPKNPFTAVLRASDATEQDKLRALAAAELRRRANTPQTDVICGLTVRYVDESQDPRIRVTLPDPGVEAKIRRITPDVCVGRAATSR